MFNLVIFGPPGSGKGTQSAKITEKYGLVHLSTGDIFREAIAQKTPLGLIAKEFIDRGELVPDEHVVKMVLKRLDEVPAATGFIFDGFPRNQNQAHILDELLLQRHSKVVAMMTLEVDHEELIRRMTIRAMEMGRTDDQNPVIIENRLNVYATQTAPVIEYFKEQLKYFPIDGMGTVDEIFGRICLTIEKMRNL